MVHASNVTGSLQPAAEAARMAHARGALLLLDAAQTVGARSVFPDEIGADLLAFPGHKSLLGPLGTGALYIRDGLEVETLREGGTGSRSEDDTQPTELPDRHEAGSHNLPGLAGLEARLAETAARSRGSVTREEGESFYRLLGGYRGVSEAAIAYAGIAGGIGWAHWREESF